MLFDNALMLLRERIGSRKFLLKQREVAEAFASGRDAFIIRPATVRNFATVAFHSIDNFEKSFSELQNDEKHVL